MKRCLLQHNNYKMSDKTKYNTAFFFQKAKEEDEQTIFEWLSEPHIKAFWDNTSEHYEDIRIFLKGRKTISSYFNGIFDYWIGYFNDTPFCFIPTSIIKETPYLPLLWKRYLPKQGVAYSIDFCIGNEAFLNKGYATPTLIAFTSFFKKKVDPDVSAFFIDPSNDNPKAKHVYAKAGFKEAGIFTQKNPSFQWGKYAPNDQAYLNGISMGHKIDKNYK